MSASLIEARPLSTAKGRARNSLETCHDDAKRQSQTDQGTARRQAMAMASQGIVDLPVEDIRMSIKSRVLEKGFRVYAI